MCVCTVAAGWIPQPGTNPGLIDNMSITGFTHRLRLADVLQMSCREKDDTQLEGQDWVLGSGLGGLVWMVGVGVGAGK